MKTKKILAVSSLIFGSALAYGQVAVPSPTTLGTSAGEFQKYNSNLAVAVRSALPTYDDAQLGKHFETIYKKYPNGGPSLKIDQNSLSSLFDTNLALDKEVSEEKLGYFLSSRQGMAYIHRELESKPLPQLEAQKQLRSVQGIHKKLLGQFGISPSEIMYDETDFMMLQSGKDKGDGTVDALTTPLVDSIYTFVQRKFEGILVEDSYAKFYSENAKEVEGLNVKWPQFVMPTGLRSFALKSKTDLLNESLKMLQASMGKGQDYNVRMAVVLRQVTVEDKLVYLPALKVGAYSRVLVPGTRNYEEEAGDMFYLDLLKERVAYKDDNSADK